VPSAILVWHKEKANLCQGDPSVVWRDHRASNKGCGGRYQDHRFWIDAKLRIRFSKGHAMDVLIPLAAPNPSRQPNHDLGWRGNPKLKIPFSVGILPSGLQKHSIQG
jgi:hypothetical protein